MSATAAETRHTRPEKPDDEQFKKDLEAIQKQQDAIKVKLDAVRAKMDAAKPGGRDPRSIEIREQLDGIRAQVAAKKSAQFKASEAIRALQDSISVRTKDLQAKSKALPFRTLAELEEAVAGLDRKVSSGTMKIVDEKRALQEMGNLNRQKKNFAVVEESRKTVDADKARLKEMKEKKADPELTELNKKYEALQGEMNELRARQEEEQKNIDALRSEKAKLQQEQNEKWDEMRGIKDTFHQNRIAYRDYTREARRIKDEKYAKQRAEAEKERKRRIATEKMEAASRPAFTDEIYICEGLIAFFDPSSAEAEKKAKSASGPRELAAKAIRTVDASLLKGKPLVREEENYFVGSSKKKGKKNRNTPTTTPLENKEVPAVSTGPTKLTLNYGVLEELEKVKVVAPSSSADVPETLEKLRKRLQHYKDNQEKVTKENIAKAQKELENLDSDEEKETKGEEAEGKEEEKEKGKEEGKEKEEDKENVTAAAAATPEPEAKEEAATAEETKEE